jgi:hypothetical protein
MKSEKPALVEKPAKQDEPARIQLLPAEQKALRILAAAQQCPEVINFAELFRQLSTLVIEAAGQRTDTLLKGSEIEVKDGALLVTRRA